ncbi:MAG: 3-oxoadipate enol-lactonase, partial [Arenicella sp.]|nr:3-oxoadipate enol-lactonase [Arenicella sp.]
HYSHHINAGKPTLVLSNSLGTTMDMWHPQLTEFKKNFSVLSYDSRGHGGSDVTPGGYSMDRLGCDVIELLDHLKLDKVLFCGLSIGGMTAQWLAAFYPQRIHALVMANTAAQIAPASLWQDRIDHVQEQGLISIWPGILARWVSDDFSAKSPENVALLKAMFESISAAGYSGCCAAIRDMDMRNLAQLNDLPTLLIAGTKDLATPASESEFLLSHYRDATLVKLDAGHLSNIEQAQDFNQNVLKFLLNFDCSGKQ